MEPSSSNITNLAVTGQTPVLADMPSSFPRRKLAIRPAQQKPRTGPGEQEIAISRWLRFIKVEKKLQLNLIKHRRRFLLYEMGRDDEVIRKFFKANSKSPIVVWLRKLQLDKRHIQTEIGKEYRKLYVVETELKTLLRIRQDGRMEKGISNIGQQEGFPRN